MGSSRSISCHNQMAPNEDLAENTATDVNQIQDAAIRAYSCGEAFAVRFVIQSPQSLAQSVADRKRAPEMQNASKHCCLLASQFSSPPPKTT